MSGMEWSFRLFRAPFVWVVRACVDVTQDRSESWPDAAVAIFGVAAAWFLQALDFVFGVLLLPATHLVQRAASRQQEYYADSTGVEIAGSREGLLSALQKLQVIEEPLPALTLARGRGFYGVLEKLQSSLSIPLTTTESRLRFLVGKVRMVFTPLEDGFLQSQQSVVIQARRQLGNEGFRIAVLIISIPKD